VTDLAVLEAVAQPSMTALVDTLERAGLVQRRPDPADQRAVLVAATREGEGYIRARSRMWGETLKALIEKLPEDELEKLVAATGALFHLLELYDDQRDAGDRPGATSGRNGKGARRNPHGSRGRGAK
jgi:DNA-binding MarR family transcriptional regulator